MLLLELLAPFELQQIPCLSFSGWLNRNQYPMKWSRHGRRSQRSKQWLRTWSNPIMMGEHRFNTENPNKDRTIAE